MAAKITLQQIEADPGRNDVFVVLHDYLQSESTTSAAQAAIAASKIPHPEGAAVEQRLDEAFFWKFWKDIIAISEQVPHDHPAQDKLVSFMRELSLLPDEGVTVWGNPVWSHLAVMGAAFREHLNGPKQVSDPDEQAEIDARWVRFHAFSARASGAGLQEPVTTAIWMLRQALEQKQTPKSTILDRDLMTAAMYIEYSGVILVQSLAASPEPRLDEQSTRMLKGGPLWQGDSGLGLDRWRFWIRRLREEAGNTTTEEAKGLALRAARLMEVWYDRRLGPES